MPLIAQKKKKNKNKKSRGEVGAEEEGRLLEAGGKGKRTSKASRWTQPIIAESVLERVMTHKQQKQFPKVEGRQRSSLSPSSRSCLSLSHGLGNAGETIHHHAVLPKERLSCSSLQAEQQQH